jgi:hypothetical protein
MMTSPATPELTAVTILVAFAGVFLICFMKGAFGGGCRNSNPLPVQSKRRQPSPKQSRREKSHRWKPVSCQSSLRVSRVPLCSTI